MDNGVTIYERIENPKLDVILLKQHPKSTDDRFVGMVVMGVYYSEKQQAWKAMINDCKSMTSPDPIPLGEYREFSLELSFNISDRSYEVKIKGATVHNVAPSDDLFGNIIRFDNRIESIHELLETGKAELVNTANLEVQKSFAKEDEL